MFLLFLVCALPWDLFFQALLGQTSGQASGQAVRPADLVDVTDRLSGAPSVTSKRQLSDGFVQEYPNPIEEEVGPPRAEIPEKEEEEEAEDTMSDAFKFLITAFIAYAAISTIVFGGSIIGGIIFMIMYKSNVHDLRPPLALPGVHPAFDPTGRDPLDQFGLFDCFSDCDACLHGFFCQPCRVADSWGTVRVLQYYMGIFVFLCVPFVAGMVSQVLSSFAKAMGSDFYQAVSPFLSVAGQLASGAVLGYFRSRLRENLSGKKGNDKLLIDALIWAFCGCCASVQEARTVDAYNGVHVRCCCRLESTMQQQFPLVGPTTAVVPMASMSSMAPMPQGMSPMAQDMVPMAHGLAPAQGVMPPAQGMVPMTQGVVVQGNAPHQWG